MDLSGSIALSGDTIRYREEVELSIEREWPTVAILGVPRSLTIYRSFHRTATSCKFFQENSKRSSG